MIGCTVDGCGNAKTIARGLCWKHYLRFNRHGDTAANKNPNRGSRRYVSDGYVMILTGPRPNQYTAEHVLMAEKALGRTLPPKAVVHHVDRDGTNNNTKSPWNLIVCPNQAYHMLLHRRAVALGYEDRRRQVKLTDVQVSEIRASKEPSRKAALRYGVSPSTIKQIRSGHLRKSI